MTTVFKMHVLTILETVEPFYFEHDKGWFAELCCLKAHVYFFSQNEDMARHYIQYHKDDYAQHIHKIHSYIGHYVLQMKELYEIRSVD